MNLTDKCHKYIIIGRKCTIKNLDGDPILKLISEIYQLIENTSEPGGIAEYRKIYYREIIGGRGIDTGNLDSGQSYVTFDRTIGDFFDINFGGFDALEENVLLKFRSYKNRRFINRARKTTFHEEYDIVVDPATGNVISKKKELELAEHH